MSSLGLKASFLIRLQARSGEWVPLRALADHAAVRLDTALDACMELTQESRVHYALREGVHCFGLGVEGVVP